MDKWIRESVEWSDDDCEITCPYCNGPSGFVTKYTSLKYCPHCGTRMYLTDAELIDTLKNIVEGRGKIIECLEKELDEKDKELLAKHNEYAQLRHEYDLLNAVCEDMKKVLVKIRPSEWAAIAKKHKED